MGVYVLTKPGVKLDSKDVTNITMSTSIGMNHSIPKGVLVDGKYVFSQIVPPGINLTKENDKNETVFEIRNGVLIKGIVDKSIITTILQKTWFQYGSVETQNFIDDLQRMILQFLLIHGYTISIKDAIMDQKVYDDVYKIIETKRKEVLTIITEFENDPSTMDRESLEIIIVNILQSIQSDAEKVVMPNFTSDNGIYNCIESKSAGLRFNAVQIICCIGQVILDGKMIQKKFNNRTLPCFFQYDDSPAARGFCHNSFMKGLNPHEFFFHVMSGREGVISSAIKTADKPHNLLLGRL